MKTIFLSESAKVGDKKKKMRRAATRYGTAKRETPPVPEREKGIDTETLDAAEKKVDPDGYEKRRKAVMEKREARKLAARHQLEAERRSAMADYAKRKKAREELDKKRAVQEQMQRLKDRAGGKRDKGTTQRRAILKDEESKRVEEEKPAPASKPAPEAKPEPEAPKPPKVEKKKEPKPAPAPKPEPEDPEEENHEDPESEQEDEGDDWWERLEEDEQEAYLKSHPKSKLKVTKKKDVEDEEDDHPVPTGKKRKEALDDAHEKVVSALSKISPDQLSKFSEDMKALQDKDKSVSRKALNTLSKLGAAAFMATVSAAAFMTPFPELSRAAGAMSVYQLTGAKMHGLPEWWTSDGVQSALGPRKSDLKWGDDVYEDPDKFKTAVADLLTQETDRMLDPRIIKLMKKHMKKEDDNGGAS